MKSLRAEDSRQLVCQLFDSICRSQPEELTRLTTPDFQWTVMGSGSFAGTMDKAGYIATLMNIANVLDGPLVIETTDWTIDGDRVAVEATSDAKIRDGRRYRNSYHFAIQLRGGKVSSVKEYGDSLHIERLFGTLAAQD